VRLDGKIVAQTIRTIGKATTTSFFDSMEHTQIVGLASFVLCMCVWVDGTLNLQHA
jgi:hypothetical protein